MPYEFKRIHLVEFSETDMAGIVHFANYFRMMEATEHAFFRSLGFSIHQEVEGHVTGWPRVSATCDYLRPLRFEDEVEIHLLVAEVRSRSLRYRFIFRVNGVEVARGGIAAVCATVAHGKLVPVTLPAALREQVTAAPPELLGPG
jgi:YbgC/YbaW family acyl-CoA thioester hydrolase